MKIKDLFSFNMLCDINKHNLNLTCSLGDICIAIRGTFGSQSSFAPLHYCLTLFGLLHHSTNTLSNSLIGKKEIIYIKVNKNKSKRFIKRPLKSQSYHLLTIHIKI